ncbi:TPA: hypothetical protein NGT00_004673 [Vibrio parahaemolyticus]|nr:hypothetical protein [Vibrio parahaemolyticus]HCG6739042.1 hypothetical protein [Vibrio parahaemolyticus]
MKTYQFLTKDSVVVHIELATETHESEMEQLLEQGFQLSGEPLVAIDLESAYKQYQEQHGGSESEYPLIGSLVDLPQALALRAILGG